MAAIDDMAFESLDPCPLCAASVTGKTTETEYVIRCECGLTYTRKRKPGSSPWGVAGDWRRRKGERVAFLTGSRRYGAPGPGSDTDLVVYMGHLDKKAVEAAVVDSGGTTSDDYGSGLTLKLGKLNLIVVGRDDAYRVWREGTELLAGAATSEPRAITTTPATREQAVECFARLRQAAGLFPLSEEDGSLFEW